MRPFLLLPLLCCAVTAQDAQQARGARPVQLGRGLLLHYACEHDRPVALDTSGHNHHGKLLGAKFERVDGQLALRFRGFDDHGDVVRVPHTKVLSSPERTGALTMALWIKVKREPREFPVMLCKGGNHRPAWGGYEFHLNTNPDNDLQITSGAFTAVTHNAFGKWIDKRRGQWLHVAFTMVRGGKVTFYVDGKATGDTFSYHTDIRQALRLAERDLFVGGPDPDHHQNRAWFDGWMDEVRIYDRALHANEVKTLFSKGRT